MSIRVLLVDDVADVRRLVRVALRFRGGFDVIGEARAGQEAVELAAALRPDIVLLDLGLPDLAGRDVLTRIRAVAPDARVVVFTGADPEDRAYIETHTDGYVLKDAELDYLVGLLEDLGRTSAHTASAEFDADVRTVPEVRDWVRHTLERWGVTAEPDEALLVATELAANAVLHAGTSYQVRLSAAPGLLRIEVADDGAGTPEPQPFSSTAESGRGVVLVSALATSWGIETEGGPGKVTWAELSL
ncbi:MAG TPA: response regulator [Nocardioides sp.]|nr:response regulator [Nocardioides sp.]